MSTIFERIEKDIKDLKKDKTEKIKKEVKKEIINERLGEIGRGKSFLEKLKLIIKIWS